MVARINTSKSISKALNYNEQKLKTGTAELLFASGFIKATEKLNFSDKLKQFQRYISLSEAVVNTLHVSLNFDLKDNLSREKLIAISADYMTGIGFANQPYLVYQHFDAGHPHIHIVTTNIQKDGSRISTHNLGRNESEKTRKKIELEYRLIKAQKTALEPVIKINPVTAQKVIYGKQAMKQAVSNVLKEVIANYKYGSLPEFNAVLWLYNVNASRGEEDSLIYRNRGLCYRVLDSAGAPVGPPLKASSFYFKPTLVFLEEKFTENELLKKPHANRLRTEIQYVLNKQNHASIEAFIRDLEKNQICAVLRKTKEGLIYGITYVDHKSKTVFNGSDLGKPYSAKAILSQFNLDKDLKKPLTDKPFGFKEQVGEATFTKDQTASLLSILMQSEQPPMNVPYPLKKDSKKKKKRRIHL
jgi:Relaxase/Mobilisation nuclease domain